MIDLTSLTYPELLAYKKEQVRIMLDSGLAEDCRTLAMQWGREVALPRRHTTVCRCFELKHPTLDLTIHVTATEAPGPWHPEISDYLPDRSIRVTVGDESAIFGGSLVLYYSAHNPESEGLYVPGVWEKPVRAAIAKVKEALNMSKNQNDEAQRLALLQQLHAGEDL